MTSVIKLEYFVSPLISKDVNLFDYVNGLRLLKEFVEYCDVDVRTEPSLLMKMAEEGYYPCDKIFNGAFPKGEECIFSPQDVVRLVNSLISNVEEFSCEIETHEVEWKSFDVEPEVEFISLNRKECIFEFLKSVMIKSKIQGGDCSIFYNYSRNQSFFNSFSLKAVVSDVFPDLDEDTPFEWSHEVSTFFNIQDYFLSLKPFDLFSRSDDSRELKCALYCGCIDFLNKNKIDIQLSWDDFKLGGDFYDSLVRNQSGPMQTHSAVVFETIIQVICRNPKNEVIKFRESANSTTQRTYGDLRAFRTHITESHQALRLMFWVDVDKVITLANVGSKFEERISIP